MNYPKNRFIFITIFIIVLIIFVPDVLYASDEIDNTILQEEKNVLYISSYSYSLVITPLQLQGIEKRFEGQPIHLDAEYMDSKRYNDEENYLNFYKLLKYKIDRGLNYDAVIVADDNGLNFIMENKESLFPDTPIIFLGINSLETAQKSSLDPLVAGIYESHSVYESLEFAYQIMPAANRLVCLIDNTKSSRVDFEKLMTYEKDFPGLEFTTVNMSEMTHEQFFTALKEYDRNDIVFYIHAVEDINSNAANYRTVYRKMDSVLNTPVFSLMVNGIGEGIFGGNVLSHESMGYKAADMVMNYFYGEPIENMGLSTELTNHYIVDYEQFMEFGFDEDVLPEDTIFINKEPSYWEQNKKIILIASSIVIFESFVILLLYINVRRRRASEKKLKESQRKTRNANEKLTNMVDELNIANNELEISIQEINERDRKIYNMINFDKLTGLLSRYALKEMINRLIKEKKSLAITILDMDNFKSVNDAYGNQFGNDVLRDVARRLKNLEVEKEYHVSRFADDEFLIIFELNNPNIEIYNMLKYVEKAIGIESYINGIKISTTASIGASIFPKHGLDFETLRRCADVALVESKKRGKNCFTIYDDVMAQDFKSKLHFQNLLKEAFMNNEIYLDYQPLINTDEYMIYGYEALIRWYSDELGQVNPARLIKEAEEISLIIQLGNWIFSESVLFLKQINSECERSICVSVNISAIQLMYKGFFDDIVKIVEEEKINPNNICLEITETAIIEDIECAAKIVAKLSDYGFRIALDDFGTGYSSLKYLRNLPIDILKIDKVFIDNINTSMYDRSIIDSVIRIAREKSIAVVAEGVEVENQLVILNSFNCKLIQGYLFSKPLHKDDAVNVVNKSFAIK